MKKYRIASLSLLPLLAYLAGCAPAPQTNYGELASGKVKTVNSKKLILQDEKEFIFVDMSEVKPALIKRIRRGDTVTLLGKTELDAKGTPIGQDVQEIVLKNGTHLKLAE